MEINGISNSYFFDTEFVPNAEVYPTENPIIAGDFYGDFFNEPQMRVLRVAAYVRVSTEHEEQEESFELQKAYFEELLNENPNWISVGIYSDFGVSATSREKRTGFKRLMRHCEEGRIDRIITKSISRFARNTYDFLNALDILKKNNITIAFEKERIDTAIAQNDMMLTAFGAVAQEESRSISANIRWAVEKHQQRGEVPNCVIYGYRYADGDDAVEILDSGYKIKKVVINEEEAKVVRRIFEQVDKGKSYAQIARELNFDNISAPESNLAKKRKLMKETPKGILNKDLDEGWTARVIGQIIRQERYAGDVKTMKTYTLDYKSHKMVKNKGEREQYCIQNHHPAIIDRELFERVQRVVRLNQEKAKGRSEKKLYPFSGRLVCGECGRFFRRQSNYVTPIWFCSSSVYSYGKRVCYAESVEEPLLEFMIRCAFIKRFDANGRTMKIDEQTNDFIIIDGGFTIEKKGLLEKMKNQLEAVQLADSMELDREFLRDSVLKYQNEADNVEQSINEIKTMLEIMQMRKDILQENISDVEFTALEIELSQHEEIYSEYSAKAKNFQEQLDNLEKYWADLEKDYDWRKKALTWLSSLPNGEQGIKEFMKGLTEEYLKAFVISIEVISPEKFCVHWFDNTKTEIRM